MLADVNRGYYPGPSSSCSYPTLRLSNSRVRCGRAAAACRGIVAVPGMSAWGPSEPIQKRLPLNGVSTTE